MKIVLHIGIHKTGTSSIQNFCARNTQFLREYDVHYGLRKYLSARNVNFLGAWLAQERYMEVKEFVEDVCEKAKHSDMNCLLLSGESFFAMNTFFPRLGAVSGEEYWSKEKSRVVALASMLASHEVEVVCYVRRQDLFVESLYNQMVKQPGGLACTIDQFLEYTHYTLDFYRHLEVWAQNFGESALKVRVFDPKTDIVADFLDLALGISEIPEGATTGVHVNERLSSEVLEFKRDLNGKSMSSVRQLLSYRALVEVSDEMGENRGGCLTNEQQRALSDRYKSGNQALAKRWLGSGESCFSDIPLEELALSTPLTLTPARREEIARSYATPWHG